MTVTAFDALEYFEKLKTAGMPEELAKIQAETMRRQADAQSAALQRALDKYDDASRRELATKGDIQDVRLEMKSMEMRLLKWQIGLALAIIAIMAKGFGWLGF
ncbi:MAG: hypothetical protein OSJ28_11260 [Desulfovibrio sp.]|nr:hypothetical protein [Desulfovibrio sp.]